MKISYFVRDLGERHAGKLKIIKKGIFWILIDEQAFWASKQFGLKITKLDNETIKVGFPDSSKIKWLTLFEKQKIPYVLFEKHDENFVEAGVFHSKDILFDIDIEDFDLTKKRILGLLKIGIEQKAEKNFLLKDKLEKIYEILSYRLMLLPKKQRYYLRAKIETIFLDLLELVYGYMYNLVDRTQVIKEIFSKSLILREFTRLLYWKGYLKNENVYMDLGNRWMEVFKICKTIINKS